MYSSHPSSLGFPGSKTQSAYYPGDYAITKEEIADISNLMEQNGVLPENTRIQKRMKGDKTIYEVRQASSSIEPHFQSYKIGARIGLSVL